MASAGFVPLLPATATSLPCTGTGNTQQSEEIQSAQTYRYIPAKKHITSYHTIQQNPIPLLPALPPSSIFSISPPPSKGQRPIFPPVQGSTLKRCAMGAFKYLLSNRLLPSNICFQIGCQPPVAKHIVKPATWNSQVARRRQRHVRVE
jgi:hypothetical protein